VIILYTGPLGAGETCAMRRQALERLGHTTIGVDYQPIVQAVPRPVRRVQWRLRAGPMVRRYNQAVCDALAARPDALWVDKGLFVHPAVLEAARRAGVRHLVHYSPDNYLLAQNTSRHLRRGLPLYDVVVTTKTHNVAALERAGARRVVLSGNAYDPTVHRPLVLTPDERATFACDVSFIGRWEPERERLLATLAETVRHRLAIRGPGWERARRPAVRRLVTPGPLLGADYAKAIAAAKINLGLLSRLAADAITQRSVELPACGAFMLAERTPEHLAHFAEGREAAFFDGPDELCALVRHYLARDDERARIAAAGRARCERAAYSYDARLAEILAGLEGAR
jgi:spore maturation protein CgeB